MDLNKLDTIATAERGAFLHLCGPGGEKLKTEAGEPIGLTVLGKDSRKVRAAEHKATDTRLENIRVKGGRIQGLKSAEAEENANAILVAAVTGYTNIVVDSKELECSAENTRKLFDRFPWIREQVDEFLSDRSNHLGES